jgi:5-oxoprolinase (ATP-hydrolysing)
LPILWDEKDISCTLMLEFLSAYGMGLADVRAIRERGVEQPLTQASIPQLQNLMNNLEVQGREEFETHQVAEESAEVRGGYEEELVRKVNLKYEGTNSTLSVNFALDVAVMREEFEIEHKSRYGFIQLEKSLIVESVSVEVIQKMDTPEEPLITRKRPLDEIPAFVETVRMFSAEKWHDTPVYRREDLQPEDSISGPAIIVEKISTIVVEPLWKARLTERNHLILEHL